MDAPTTPRSRRSTWGEDATRLVEDLQRYARGQGSDGFPPWRIGYLSGLSHVVEVGTCAYKARTHRREPHLTADVVIPKEGRPTAALLDLLCWHLDQDVRRYELDDADPDEPWHRLPCGPLLVDPLFATALADARVDELGLCRRIVDAHGFGTRREVDISLGEFATISWPKVNIRMNEVHVRFRLPGTLDTYWSRGHLVVNVEEIPDTVAIAARGRLLSEIVDHEMIARSAPMKVAAVTRAVDGTYSIATDGARPAGMVPVPRPAPASMAA